MSIQNSTTAEVENDAIVGFTASDTAIYGEPPPTDLGEPSIDPDEQCREHGCARWRCDESHEGKQP